MTPHELANVIHELAYLGRFVEAAIRDCAARLNGRHNFEVLEQAIALYKHGSAGVKSRAELALVLKAADLPEFHTNVHVEDIEVDFHWPELQLVVEIDGPHHGRPSTRREDRLKERVLQTRRLRGPPVQGHRSARAHRRRRQRSSSHAIELMRQPSGVSTNCVEIAPRASKAVPFCTPRFS